MCIRQLLSEEVESRSDWRRYVRKGGNRTEKKGVISVERKMRGSIERDVSYTLDLVKKEEGAKYGTLGDLRRNE